MAKKGSGLFQKGNKIATGRGNSKNKYSLNAIMQLSDKGFNPLENLMWANDTIKNLLDYDLALVTSGKRSPMESDATKLIRLYVDVNKELASYVFQKPKSDEDKKTVTLLGDYSVDSIEKAEKVLEIMKAQAKEGESVG